jgi:hypothetical protein
MLTKRTWEGYTVLVTASISDTSAFDAPTPKAIASGIGEGDPSLPNIPITITLDVPLGSS